MNRHFSVCMMMLIFAMLACAQPSSGALSDIACALQGLPDCNQPSGGGGGGGGGPSSAVATPIPLNTATLVPTSTPTALPVDVLKVVYTKNGQIWLWDDIAASSRQLTHSGQDMAPKISDDGLVIVFRRRSELWAIDSDGKNERILTSGVALTTLVSAGANTVEPRQFDFGPFSHDVYLNITIVNGPVSEPEYNLAKINVDSPSLQALLDGSQGGGQFVFSPDGTKIALVRNDKINVVNSDGSDWKPVFTFPPVLLNTGLNYIPEIRWMPNGSGFTTVIPPEDALTDPAARTRFYYISADGEQTAQLAEFVAAPPGQSQPYISPDVSKVLYTKPQGTNLELHIIDASTTDHMYLSYNATSMGLLGWTPDSEQVMYWIDDKRRAWFASPSQEQALLGDVDFAENITWIDSRRYLFLNELELRLRIMNEPSIVIDDRLSDSRFDFIVAPTQSV